MELLTEEEIHDRELIVNYLGYLIGCCERYSTYEEVVEMLNRYKRTSEAVLQQNEHRKTW